MAKEYTEQQLQQMREQAIQGAFAMQRRSRFLIPDRKEKKQRAQQGTEGALTNVSVPEMVPQPETMPQQAEASGQKQKQGMHNIPRYYHTTHAVETVQVPTPQEGRKKQQQPKEIQPIVQQVPPPQQQERAQERSGLGGILPGMDNEGMLLFFLLLLLQQENSDQLLLFAIIYIMM